MDFWLYLYSKNIHAAQKLLNELEIHGENVTNEVIHFLAMFGLFFTFLWFFMRMMIFNIFTDERTDLLRHVGNTEKFVFIAAMFKNSWMRNEYLIRFFNSLK